MEFHQTVRGQRFYDHTMPSIMKSLECIAKAMTSKGNEQSAMPPSTLCRSCVSFQDGKHAPICRSCLQNGFQCFLHKNDPSAR